MVVMASHLVHAICTVAVLFHFEAAIRCPVIGIDVPQKQLITDEGEFCNAAHANMFESYLNGIDAKGHDDLFMRASENIAHATESLCRACVEPVPVYFTRARKDGKVGLRVTRRIVSSYELDEAEIEKRSGSRSQTRVRQESVLGRETRNGKGKWGLRVTRGGRNGLSVPRGSKFRLRTTKSDNDHSDNEPKFWNKKNG